MIFTYIWRGILFGLIVSIPVGPVAILCIQRTLNKGRLAGFVSGLGAVCADCFYIILAAFGINIIISYIEKYVIYIKIIGSIILIIMGIRLIPINPAKQLRNRVKQKRKGLIGDFFSAFGITLSNPILLVIYAGFLGAFFITSDSHSFLHIMIFLLGTFCGAVMWWFSVTMITSILKNKIKLRKLLIINRITGILIILFAIFVLITLFLPKEYQIF